MNVLLLFLVTSWSQLSVPETLLAKWHLSHGWIFQMPSGPVYVADGTPCVFDRAVLRPVDLPSGAVLSFHFRCPQGPPDYVLVLRLGCREAASGWFTLLDVERDGDTWAVRCHPPGEC
jgi:hypothetical protein